MTTTALRFIGRLRHYGFRHVQIPQMIADWRSAVRAGNELSQLGDRYLQDIGVSRRTSARAHEKCKPFWMP